MEALVRLKARLLDVHGENVLKKVKFLAFDTSAEQIEATNMFGERVQLAKNTEAIYIGDVPIPAILENIDRHPRIKSWLPSDLSARARTTASHQLRALGRLALFHHFSNVQSVLAESMRELTQIRILDSEQSSYDRHAGINVFLVTSLAGGTGSGMFLDITYLIRYLLDANSIRNSFSFVTGMLVLPEAFGHFGQAPGSGMEVNTYVALRELEHFMAQGKYESAFTARETVRVSYRPFDVCYLIGSSVARIKSSRPIEQAVAESVFQLMASQVGTTHVSRFDNVSAHDKVDKLGSPTVFSSIGTSSLVFPASRLVESCANQLALDLINKQLLRKATKHSVLKREFRNFVEVNLLSPDNLLTKLARDPDRHMISILLSREALAGVAPEELHHRAKRYITQYEAKVLNTSYMQFLETNTRELTQHLSEATILHIDRLINTPEKGLMAARAFINLLNTYIEALADELNRGREGLTEKMGRLSHSASAAEQALAEASQSFIRLRSNRTLSTLETYLALQQDLFHTEFEISKRNHTIDLLTDLTTVLSEQRRRITACKERLNVVATRIQGNLARIGSTRQSPYLSYQPEVDTSTYIVQQFKSLADDLERHCAQFSGHYGPLTDWLAGSEDEVLRSVLEYSRDVFAGLWDTHIEDFIVQEGRHALVEQYLDELRLGATPLLRLDQARMETGGTDLQMIRILGVYDREGSIFRAKSLDEVASTADPYAVTMLTTEHGIPLEGLASYQGYREAYRNSDRVRRRSAHIFDYGDDMDDVHHEARSALPGAVMKVEEPQYTYQGPAVLELNGQQRKQLQNALMEAFPMEADLAHMSRYYLNLNIYEIVSSTGLEDMTFKLIEWAGAQGMLRQLVAAALMSRPGSRALRLFALQVGFKPIGSN